MPGLLPRAWTSHNLSGLKRLWSFWPGLQDLPVSHSRPWIGRETFIRCPKACAMHDGRKGGASACKMEATTAGVGRLEEEALRRKERLKALREKTGRKTHEGTGGLPAWPLHGTKWLHFSPPKAIQLFLRVFSKGYQDKEDGEPKTKHLREEEEEGEKHRELRLRNYVPEDEDLKKRRVPQAKPVAVEEKVKEQLEAAKPEPVIEEVDLANLAPRKPDWDLKRDVAKKLEKLKKRTQRAIAELIRKCSTWEGGVLPTGWWPEHRNPSHSFCLLSIAGERLKGQDDSLASAVDAATEQKACDSD
uniref:Coiled-coil domain-containing protein 12 n=1 Tax=Piliocolobus tephrosceles TaxID=591936 RepID=A0A8C9LJV3_9PRIM